MLRQWVLLVAIGVALAAGPTFGADVLKAAGSWEGEIKVPGSALKIQITLDQDAKGALRGTIDIPLQGLRDLKLIDVLSENDKVAFALPEIPGEPKFEGTLSADGLMLSGDYTQAGQTFPFELKRNAEKPRQSGTAPEKGIPGDGLAGVWQGAIRVGPLELRLVFNFVADEKGNIAGTLKSIDQTPDPIPLSAVKASEQHVDIAVDRIGGKFEGELNKDQSEISGTWLQGGQSMPLVLKRISAEPKLVRPQEPKPPFPYDVEEVTFENAAAKVTLAGTLTKPKSAGPHPAVVMISGSGPQDRDEQIMGHKPFAVIADHLTRKGIAVLRFDDRGIGRSTGEFGTATHYDFVNDTLAAVDWLRARPEIDARQIGLVGHSEGGVVAPLAAVERPDDIHFIVMMAGVGVPMQQLLSQQSQEIGKAMGLPEELLEREPEAEQEMYRLLGAAGDDLEPEELKQKLLAVMEKSLEKISEETRDKLGLTTKSLEGRLQMVVTPWFRQLARYNPRPTLEKVRCPVLAINGEKDLQVAADDNLEAIRTALAAGGNTDVHTVNFPGLNHLFQECTTGSLAEYGVIEQTFAPVALETISAWLLKHVEVKIDAPETTGSD